MTIIMERKEYLKPTLNVMAIVNKSYIAAGSVTSIEDTNTTSSGSITSADAKGNTMKNLWNDDEE